MSLRDNFRHLFQGADPKLPRMLRYWAAASAIYVICIALLQFQIHAGTASRDGGIVLSWFGASGVVFFYGLVRFSPRLGISPRQLAVLQALFAITCTVWAYAVTGPARGGSLMVLLVVIVFCTFSLRPRETLLLCGTAIAALGGTIAWLVSHDPARFPIGVEGMHFAFAACALVSVTLMTGEMSKLRSSLKRQKEELMSALATIRSLATLDELTSLANRRHMNDVLRDEERRQGALDKQVCLALLDIDFFKKVNDKYGHAGGDAVLRTFAIAARAELRSADMLARWGGEEFLLLLPDTGIDEASVVVKRMAERVAAIRIPELDVDLRITFSAGLVEHNRQEAFADTIKRADLAMYHAKSAGRDQVIAA